jgi:nitroreductase
VQFQEVVRGRRMVRRYRAAPVAAGTLERILDTSLRGPSAGFAQGVHLVVVTDAERRAAIARACGEPEHVRQGRDPWLSVAPVHVVLAVNPGDYRARYSEPDKSASTAPDDWPVPWWWVDGGAALMLLLLAATDEGLGAGVLQIADRDAMRRLLGIPADVEPMILVTLGHAADDPGPAGSATRGRRPSAQTTHRERFSLET